MHELDSLIRAYDGPIPPAELSAARWGPGAHARLLRAADAALIEARLRAAVAVLGQLRGGRSGTAGCDAAGRLRRLVRAVADYRRAALASAGSGVSTPPPAVHGIVTLTR